MTRTSKSAYRPRTLSEETRVTYGIRERQAGPLVVAIAITLNLTELSGRGLVQVVHAALERGNKWFVLDVSQCPYIDDYGVRALKRVASLAKDAGGGVTIDGASESHRALFRLRDVARLVVIRDSTSSEVAR